MTKKTPNNPNKAKNADQPCSKTIEKCPLDDFELIELIEVIKQDKEKWVIGPCPAAVDKVVVTEGINRQDKDGGNYKQFINLNPSLEGAAMTHAEYGRKILFRARVRQKNGNTDKLAGHKVNFEFSRTDGPNRSDPPGTATANKVWKQGDLEGVQKEGFGSTNGAHTTSSTTDAKGWTAVVDFYLSQFAGDQFEISCKLDPSVQGATSSPPKKTSAKYVVWRKFWYQMTYASGYSAKQPAKAESAYKELFAEMVKASEKKFTKSDFPADLQDRTFLPEYQLKSGGGNGIVANVGTGNISEFASNAKLKKDSKTNEPVKENLIVCEYQCDPDSDSALKKYKITSNGQLINIDVGSGGNIISKPALKAGSKLVVSGEWSKKKTPWHKEADITDAHLEVVSSRTSTQQVKINLPAGVTPSATKPIWVKLKVATSQSYLGWATANGIVAVYQPSVPAGQGSEEDFNDTVAHEFGHKFNQSPESPQAKPLLDHPLQYVGHGGSGSHCRHGATVPAGTANWQNAKEETPSPSDGDCIMFHEYSSKCKHKFCEVCKPYLQLEKMDFL